MTVVELKSEVPLVTVPAWEELLAEREELRLMVLEDKPSGRAWLAGYFGSRAEAMAAWRELADWPVAGWTKTEPMVRELPEEDWKDSYKAHFKAWKFGRLNWVPVWERPAFVLPAGEEVLWLDPGMAFGTGNHETTRLCCERLARLTEERGPRGRVIDAGCGSGILALSAAKLGYGDIVAFDNDPEAVRVSEENAALNELTGKVEFMTGDLVTGLTGRSADLLLANIQADVLMRFAGELCAAAAPGGRLCSAASSARNWRPCAPGLRWWPRAGGWSRASSASGRTSRLPDPHRKRQMACSMVRLPAIQSGQKPRVPGRRRLKAIVMGSTARQTAQ